MNRRRFTFHIRAFLPEASAKYSLYMQASGESRRCIPGVCSHLKSLEKRSGLKLNNLKVVMLPTSNSEKGTLVDLLF